MKKCVRAVTAVLAVVLAVIYGLVGFGCWALPDTVRTGGGDAAYFGGLFTVSGGRAGAVDATTGQNCYCLHAFQPPHQITFKSHCTNLAEKSQDALSNSGQKR